MSKTERTLIIQGVGQAYEMIYPNFWLFECGKWFSNPRNIPWYPPILDQPAMVRPSFHDTSCSRPCICRDEDHISPSSRLVRKRTWWSLPPTTVHDRPSPPKWPAHKRSTWNECEGTGPNWSGILDASQSQGRTKKYTSTVKYIYIWQLLRGQKYEMCVSQNYWREKIRLYIWYVHLRNSVMSTFSAPSKPGRLMYVSVKRNFWIHPFPVKPYFKRWSVRFGVNMGGIQ